MSHLGQNRKTSMRANVFRCSPNNGHRQGTWACPFRAMKRLMHCTKIASEGQLDSDLIAELEIDRGLAAPHADIFARDLLQNDPHIAWRNAEWLEVPNDRLVERAFGRE